MARSKYEEWIKPENLILIQGWKRDGLTDEEIASNIGISRMTLHRWQEREKQKHKETGSKCYICDALKIGKQQANFVIENKLFEKARSGNTTAMIFWLKNNWRDKYNDSQLSVEERDQAKQRARKLKAEADLAEYQANMVTNPDNVEDKTVIIDDITKETDDGKND